VRGAAVGDLKQGLAHEALERGAALHHVLQEVAPEAVALFRRNLVPVRAPRVRQQRSARASDTARRAPRVRVLGRRRGFPPE